LKHILTSVISFTDIPKPMTLNKLTKLNICYVIVATCLII